jgi:transposase-like protein
MPYVGDEEPATHRTCPECFSTSILVQIWESDDGGHEDNHFRCTACGYTWWIDGIDS